MKPEVIYKIDFFIQFCHFVPKEERKISFLVVKCRETFYIHDHVPVHMCVTN